MGLEDRILIVTRDSRFLEDAQVQLKRIFSKDLTFLCTNFEEALNQPKEADLPLVLIDSRQYDEPEISFIKKICSHFEFSRVVCAGFPANVSIVLELVKLGVKDFLQYPFDDEELKEIAQAVVSVSRPIEVVERKKKGRLVTLYSPKGGVGVTLMAANLAVGLARQNLEGQVAVCDFSPQCGDVATYLNLVPKYTLRDVIQNNALLDDSFLQGVMIKHSSGVAVLAAPPEDHSPEPSELESIQTVLKLLRDTYDYVLIDAGRLDRGILQHLMSESDLVFLIGSPDVIAIKGLVNCYHRMRNLGVDRKRIKVVINRYNSKSRIDAKEFEKKTEHPITALVPNDYLICAEAVNTGQPVFQISLRSELAKKIEEIAGLISNSFDTRSSKGNGSDGLKEGRGFRWALPQFGSKESSAR